MRYYRILHGEVIMDAFNPFLYDPRTKKKELEPEPLYIELIPPPQKEEKLIEQEAERVVIIEIF